MWLENKVIECKQEGEYIFGVVIHDLECHNDSENTNMYS